ncbi:tyrosyl-DNA phosphodiesterase 2-like isoform X2 [Pollicipes pollicipes]|uniref:tyrosyl-DNA phosphodiesterase 2-like isoform X2 n=1 Tax=Pollicipes pollicipes TaxID=41117 RepID=UPI0018850B20|nr:tyrosyl-DNA phosphodiesterase 2-like isoform X2 [Pollicipes pollicipes]
MCNYVGHKMSDNEAEEDNIPDAATCQERCSEFASITGTDEACAQFFLQDHEWDLTRSLNSYFEARTSGAGVHVVPGSEDASAIITIDDQAVSALDGRKRRWSSGEAGGATTSRLRLTASPPRTFSFITWNIDGLDQRCLKKRTKMVCKIIEMEAPDIVFLQELTPNTCVYIETKLPQYQLLSAGADRDYFTATLLRKYRVYCDAHRIVEYPRTSMLRNLLCVEAHIGPLKLTLLNTHLESTKEHTAVRQEQLKECFSRLKATSADHVVLLAGDLNLRDSDVTAVGGLPAGVSDLWERCGRRKEVEFTWDMQRNTNLEMPGRFKPRLRFDRVYLRATDQVTAEHFGLVGLEKVQGTQSFPSDHWGVQVYFGINQTQPV